MVTCFPKLLPDAEANDTNNAYPTKSSEVDITMKGAQSPQVSFRQFIDAVDEHLIDFMMDNQALIGKKNLTRPQLETIMKRQFKQRVSVRTGRQYADAMTCRYKGPIGTYVQVVDNNLTLIDLTQDPGYVGYNDIIRVALRYNGAYARAGYFGNSWELVMIQKVGHVQEQSVATTNPSDCFNAVVEGNENDWPKIE